MSMQTMHRLEDMCCRELDKIVERGELSTSTLEQAHLLTDTIKNVHKIDMLTGESSRGYARSGGEWHARGSYDRDGYDSDRYAHDDRARYDRDASGHYDAHDDREDMIQRLERMMGHSNDPAEAAAYRRAMEQLRHA